MKFRLLGQVLLTGALLAGTALAADRVKPNVPRTDAEIAQSVRHEVLMYPYYGVFDDITFSVDHAHVTLKGAVTEPVKKSDIENIVAKLPGVEGVTGNIQVLPLSPMDNQLRRQVAASIYRFPALSRYGLGTHPSIHIIVDNGHVTLTGVVDSQTDKNLAALRASGAGLSFGAIVNNLQVMPPSRT
jgi:hyperosmotically inducible protein